MSRDDSDAFEVERAEVSLPVVRPSHQSSERVRLEVDVSLSSESHFYAGLSGDISRGGLFVATYAPLRLGEIVVLRFTLLESPVEVEGVVRWQRPASEHSHTGVGVEFRGLLAPALALIEAYCATRAALYYDLEDGTHS